MRNGRGAVAAGGIAGLEDIPRDQVCRWFQETEEAGRNSLSGSFVHAARKPEIGSFIRAAHMTGRDGLFKAAYAAIGRNDEQSGRIGTFGPLHPPHWALKCRFQGWPRVVRAAASRSRDGRERAHTYKNVHRVAHAIARAANRERAPVASGRPRSRACGN